MVGALIISRCLAPCHIPPSSLRNPWAVRELNREQRLSLATVALFTEPDRQAMFVREADDAIPLGPATFVDQRDGQPKSSYQNREYNENLEVAAVAGSYASVIGGVPAAAVVFAREVATRTNSDPRVKAVQEQIVQADDTQRATLQVKLNKIGALVRSEKVGEVASEFDHIHTRRSLQW